MDLQLAGRTAYITGAAGGIGAATVRSLAAEGVRVFAVDIDVDTLASFVEEEGLTSVHPYRADLSTEEGCVEAARAGMQHLGGAPDVVVNSAGVGHMLPFEEIGDGDFTRTFELNFFAVVRTCRVLLPAMRASAGGSVVNISSDLASQPEDLFVDYAASKAALSNFSKAMSRVYAPSIRVNQVCPGPVWTPLWYRPGGYVASLQEASGMSGEQAVRALIEERGIPLGRLGTPAEVAAAVTFLSSPLSAFTTGASLGVDGGTVRSAF